MSTSCEDVGKMSCQQQIDLSPDKSGGLLKEILKEGIGNETPSPGCKVNVHYVGTLTDGTKFDSSRDRGEPFNFNIGKGMVIKAWDLGVATMKQGEIAKFTCRSDYAYGESGSPPKIPPNATLIFEIEMIDWAGEDLSHKKDNGIIRYILKEGEGNSTPNEGALVEVHIVGRYNGIVFDERTVSFHIGEGAASNICDGLEKAIEKCKKGEKSKIVIKSEYGFRETGNSTLNVPPNVDLEYTIDMKNFEKAKEPWEMDPDAKIDQAKFLKDKGTIYFKNENFHLAVKMYKRVISFMEYETGFSEEKDKERISLLLAGYLNLAMCYLKLLDYLEARNQCDKALDLDANNVKGLFRRGQAYLGFSEPEKAKLDFEAVLKLEQDNKAALSYVNICNVKIKEQKGREKKIYANMFEKFAQKDKEKEEERRRNEPDVMKTLGEWGQDEREREMTDFERENPNILMLNRTGEFKNM